MIERREMPEDATNSGDEENGGDGVLFYVNSGSAMPLSTDVYERMWTHAAKLNPDVAERLRTIRDQQYVDETQSKSVPSAPVFNNNSQPVNVLQRISNIQRFMNTLQYNHVGTQFFEIRKNRPITGLMDTAKDMIKESLPIKCLESVILSIYLTNNLSSLDRFPLSFRTFFQGHEHRHVVLALYYHGKYGALGMSRRKELMYKPLVYDSLSELVASYIKAYHKYWHKVKKVRIGCRVIHETHSYEIINWTNFSINIGDEFTVKMAREIDRYSRELRSAIQMSELYEKRITLNKEFCNLAKRNLQNVKKLGKRSKITKSVPLKLEQISKTIELIGSDNQQKELSIGDYQIRI